MEGFVMVSMCTLNEACRRNVNPALAPTLNPNPDLGAMGKAGQKWRKGLAKLATERRWHHVQEQQTWIANVFQPTTCSTFLRHYHGHAES